MCGIIGYWRQGEVNKCTSEVVRGLRLLSHRGPDFTSYEQIELENSSLVLGHARLSIIDLSEAGNQPMSSHDDRFSIIFNGEIYNYKEIREELRNKGLTINSDTDTEVLIEAWRFWGDKCLEKLIGMFAFVILDKETKKLFCARDAFGIKPFFYSYREGSFSFSSEMTALLSMHDNVEHKLNLQRSYDYLINAIQDSGGETFVKGVNHLPPAHLVSFDVENGKLGQIKRWWKPQVEERAISYQQATEQVRQTFLDSIRLHLRSDVPLGAALSGGIDSSALVCAMRHLEPNLEINTFSFISTDPRLSEEKWIDLVNNHVRAVPHKVIVDPNEIGSELEDLVRVQGEPFCTTSMYAQYRVFKKARESGITVVLEGQGADELLAGYEGYPGQRMRSMLERTEFGSMLSFAKQYKAWPERDNKSAWRALAGQLIPDNLYLKMLSFVRSDASAPWLDTKYLAEKAGVNLRPFRVTASKQNRGRRVSEVLSQSLTQDGLPSLLRYGDRNAMRFSIENRVPFLTIPLANLLLSLPEEYLISRKGETKSIFRSAMRGIVPDAILDRRDKIGFETPMQSWMSSLAPGIRKQMSYLESLPFINMPLLLNDFDLSTSEGGHFTSLNWRIINLAMWMKKFNIKA